MRKAGRLTALLLAAVLLSGCTAGAPTKNRKKAAPVEAPKLETLTLDGGYSLDFSPDRTDYEVHIPDGRARLPRITASAQTGTVRIDRAVLPDGAASGTSWITVTDGEGTGTYTVTFVRDSELGFRLQYDDYYAWTPFASAVYTSSDPSVIEAGENGVLHAAALSSTPVTVTAEAKNGETAELTVDCVEKAALNLFLITGQSNASGTYDVPEGENREAFYTAQMRQTRMPQPGTVYCTDADSVGRIDRSRYDLGLYPRAGFSPALGGRWYELTGEKTLMLQTAVGGAPIEAWEKPTADTRYTYCNAYSNFYETTHSVWQQTVEALTAEDSCFELNRTYAYWLQGETGMSSSFNPNKLGPGIGDWDFGSLRNFVGTEAYFEKFCGIERYFREEFGVEFTGILLVRALRSAVGAESMEKQLYTDLVPARAAQYALHAALPGVMLVSRVSDIARPESWADSTVEGWGYMGCEGVHYNQTGHNANGVEAAENTYRAIYDREGRKAAELEILKRSGRDRFAEGEELTIRAGRTYQTAAVVLPLWSDTRAVTYSSSNPEVCSVDAYGLLTAGKSAGTAVITFSCPEAGLTRKITVKVAER